MVVTVTSREGRVSRNRKGYRNQSHRFVTSREGRVSRNGKNIPTKTKIFWSRPARDV